jgi:predicted nucleotidyltransferase
MLKSDEILDFLKQHRQDIEARFSVKRIGLFGSVLRGSASDSSDVDILVELTHPTFDQYMAEARPAALCGVDLGHASP